MPVKMGNGYMVSITMPESMHNRLKACADADERTVSWLVRKCVEIALDQIEATTKRDLGSSEK